MSEQHQHESPNLEDLTPEEANRIIHSHRKVRYGTACWPCRQRKVKCDNQSPCENCVKRDHPQLCSYKPNRTSTGKGSVGSSDGMAGSGPNHGRKRAHSPSEDNEARTPGSDRAPEAPAPVNINATYVEPDPSEVTRYLGQNSIPALLRERVARNKAEDEVETIRHDMRSILGLDNSAPYPLMSLKHIDRLTSDISTELPSDRDVMKLFRTYKETPQQFWGFVIDIDDLEAKLMVYLEDRAKNAHSTAKYAKPVSASWLAILFAVLAVGSQYHDSPYHIRTADSQKYMQIAFHFLRIGNFLLRPNFDSLQALLMIGFVLLNDMKAEASWALTGLTCRLAQSLGLHRSLPAESKDVEVRKRELVRSKLWWTCVWHDTLTSLSFDRSPMTNIRNCPPPPLSPIAETEGLAYLEAMRLLIKIISERLNPDALASAGYDEILESCEMVESIREQILPQIRTKELCKSIVDRLQHFAIRLHTAYIVSVCCRRALKSGNVPGLETAQKDELAARCKENLTETVRMFLAMHQLSVIPTRSWAFTYHGLSSAVLLGLLNETKADPEVRQLQGDLISALSATAAKEQRSPQPHIPMTDKDIELSGPLSRALMALKNIYDHGSVSGSSLKRDGSSASNSGARTPLNFQQFTGLNQAMLDTMKNPLGHFRTGAAGDLDPHQNAALAMAELQQQGPSGLGIQGYTDLSTSFGGLQQPGVTMPDLSNIDGTYMSPMDLYDSIFWESPDPWNNGFDTMNFDFLAQPPPGQPPQQQFYY